MNFKRDDYGSAFPASWQVEWSWDWRAFGLVACVSWSPYPMVAFRLACAAVVIAKW